MYFLFNLVTCKHKIKLSVCDQNSCKNREKKSCLKTTTKTIAEITMLEWVISWTCDITCARIVSKLNLFIAYQDLENVASYTWISDGGIFVTNTFSNPIRCKDHCNCFCMQAHWCHWLGIYIKDKWASVWNLKICLIFLRWGISFFPGSDCSTATWTGLCLKNAAILKHPCIYTPIYCLLHEQAMKSTGAWLFFSFFVTTT